MACSNDARTGSSTGASGWLFHRRIGLVTNDAARTASDPDLPGRVALQELGVGMIRLFSPEHGLLADKPDGAAVANGVDPWTGLKVNSLYGKQVRPSRESLEDLDTVLIDLPDVGSRFYTYIWTACNVLEACAEAGIPVMVLDRPNPIGGDLFMAEGPILDLDRWGSFLGRAGIREELHQLSPGAIIGTQPAGETFELDTAIPGAVDPLQEKIELWTATADWRTRAERILLYARTGKGTWFIQKEKEPSWSTPSLLCIWACFAVLNLNCGSQGF